MIDARWRRRVSRLALGLGALVLTAVNLDAIVVHHCEAPTPVLSPMPSISSEPIRIAGSSRHLGPCTWREHRGQHVLVARGEPFDLGYCNARLAGDAMIRQEGSLHAALAMLLPLKVVRHAFLRTALFVYRDLPEQIRDAEKHEILGLSMGYDDRWPELGPPFPRILMMHAIHDVSQAMVDNPLLACTAFAASGPATADGHTLLARNFDFEGGRSFDEDKLVSFYEPNLGLAFVGVSWAGMVGHVSGFNAAGLGVVLNAAASDDLAVRGRPTTLLVRDLLQWARTIDDALEIIRRTRVFVSDIVVLADAKTGEVAAVELTPAKVFVRREPQLVFAANHFIHPGHAADETNALRMRDGTTVSRHVRVEERLQRARGALTPALAVDILRDRRLPGDRPAAMGHRGTIDAAIAAHSVVFDLTDRKLWVSKGPHTLGEYVEYRFDDVMAGRFEDWGAIPADPALTDGTWERLLRGRERWVVAKASGDLTAAREGIELVPGSPEGLQTLARLCQRAGDSACAREAWQGLLDAQPPHRIEGDRAREALLSLAKGAK